MNRGTTFGICVMDGVAVELELLFGFKSAARAEYAKEAINKSADKNLTTERIETLPGVNTT
jgi:hypothetical protein